jgi:hypothetical protein
MSNSEWGGSGIEKVTFDYISKLIKHGSTFVELGAGLVSNREFSKIFNLYSVEQDKRYCDFYPQAKYIHAPYVNGWYDVKALKNHLPTNISAVFVDGPSGEGNRNGFLENIEMFNFADDVVIIFHDTYRESENTLAKNVASKLGMKMKEYKNEDYFISVSSREDI